MHLDSTVAGLTIKLVFSGEAESVLASHAEASMMLFKKYVESHTARLLDDASYEFPYPAPDHAADYERYLGPGVRFDCPSAAMFLPSHWLDVPSPFYVLEVWMQSFRQLSERLKQVGENDMAAYQRQIRAILRGEELPLPGLGLIADRLHVSRRTLNRRLREEGTSFRELRSELLDEWARNYLEETSDNVESIAVALGYGDTANFRRAFRARHHMTPTAYREQLQRRLRR